MSRSILEIRGIGPTAAAILAENGISNAEELAAKTVMQVAAIKGFNETRATQVIADAQTLIATDGAAVAGEVKAAKKAKVEKKVKVEKKSKPEKAPAEKKKKSKKTVAKKTKEDKKVKKVKKNDKPDKKDKKKKKSK